MKIGVIGANGQLGMDVCEAFSARAHSVIRLTHTDIDVGDLDKLKEVLGSANFDVVINTSAYHNLDLCEKNPNVSFLVNSTGAKNLAILSNDLNFKLVHYSTDYVFDGKKNTPYEVEDIPNPINVYGVSKLAGEELIQDISQNYVIIRTASLFGRSPCRAKNGLNFVRLMLKLASENKPIQVVNDQFSSPTWTADVAEQTLQFVLNDVTGLYHAVGEGGCSWYEFAQEVFKIARVQANLSPKSTVEDEKAIKRPKYSVMSNIKISKLGINVMNTWEHALRRYLECCGSQNL